MTDNKLTNCRRGMINDNLISLTTHNQNIKISNRGLTNDYFISKRKYVSMEETRKYNDYVRLVLAILAFLLLQKLIGIQFLVSQQLDLEI